MSNLLSPSSREFFESKYGSANDPWNFSNDPYELSRYDAIVAALAASDKTKIGQPHFTRAYEPGCSVGVLTERLAPICDFIFATDISSIAVARARIRCADYPNVLIEQGSVADTNPGPVDLIVLSEIGYYCTAIELHQWTSRLLQNLQPGGTLLAAHWLGFSSDHVLSGDHVHSVLHNLARESNCALTLTKRKDNFRLDKWTQAK
jgi:predicted TPR repeat methyltransferase